MKEVTVYNVNCDCDSGYKSRLKESKILCKCVHIVKLDELKPSLGVIWDQKFNELSKEDLELARKLINEGN